MIDFVLPWVDGNDPEWQKEKEKFLPKNTSDASAKRYRDWDNLQYWFRGVEKFAPWVNKIHFITYGHLPQWLNVNHKKLNIIRHADYIPAEYLPTFSSRPIELNIHRIKELAEQFVFFSDDMFIIKKIKPTHFFKNGLPCDNIKMVIATVSRKDFFTYNRLNDIEVINYNFSKRHAQINHFFKWFNFRYGFTNNISNLLISFFNTFPGFSDPHLPQPLLKSTVKEVWDKDPEMLHETSKRKFRDMHDVHQYVFRYWQLASGKFEPVKIDKYGKAYHLPHNQQDFFKALDEKSKLMICANDTVSKDEEFELLKNKIQESFNTFLPNKSSFEL